MLDHEPLLRALHSRLDRLATEKSRSFWERYLKGAVPFRGVPMASIRAAVHAWWREDGPASIPLHAQKALALASFEGRWCEDKLAGTLVLQELLLGDLGRSDLDDLGALFDRGRIADWNTCDWFCVKVLGPLVARSATPSATAGAIAAWRDAPTLWQRRASNVAFVDLAKRGDGNFPGFTSLMLDTCAVTVRSEERFAQTGVGWLLRELAGPEREAVLAFVRGHLSRLSREGLTSIVRRLPKNEQEALLRAHRQSRRDLPGSARPRR